MAGTVNPVKSLGGHRNTVVLLNGYTVKLPCRESCLDRRVSAALIPGREAPFCSGQWLMQTRNWSVL